MNILIVDFEFPEPDRASGGRRLYHIVKILREAGHELAFLSLDHWQLWKRQEDCYETALNELGVKTYREGWSLESGGAEFIAAFCPDVAILSKHYMANRLSNYLRQTNPMCKQIFDTVDVHYLRERRAGSGDWSKTRDAEFTACETADRTWTVTDKDKVTIQNDYLPSLDIEVVPNIHEANFDSAGFTDRSDVVFVGNYVHEPNGDALEWMRTSILPLFINMEKEHRFRAVGPHENLLPLAVLQSMSIMGYVEDLDGLLQRTRVGVAPLRYGAGMKGKIGSYMENGLPVLTSSIGAEGMNLTDGENARIVDDPVKFAEVMAELCRDEQQWNHLSKNGLEKVSEWGIDKMRVVIDRAISF